jgi:hypothetical protein
MVLDHMKVEDLVADHTASDHRGKPDRVED